MKKINTEILSKASYILNGENRKRIFLALLEGYKTPTELSKEINVNLSSISRTLKDLSYNKVIGSTLDITGNKKGKMYFLIMSDDFDVIKRIIMSKNDSE